MTGNKCVAYNVNNYHINGQNDITTRQMLCMLCILFCRSTTRVYDHFWKIKYTWLLTELTSYQCVIGPLSSRPRWNGCRFNSQVALRNIINWNICCLFTTIAITCLLFLFSISVLLSCKKRKCWWGRMPEVAGKWKASCLLRKEHNLFTVLC